MTKKELDSRLRGNDGERQVRVSRRNQNLDASALSKQTSKLPGQSNGFYLFSHEGVAVVFVLWVTDMDCTVLQVTDIDGNGGHTVKLSQASPPKGGYAQWLSSLRMCLLLYWQESSWP